jgi:hypothetical protein
MDYFIGDIHGQREKLERLLQNHHLIDDNLCWSGGTSTLWFMGDFVDRGPDGVGAIELVMRLQTEAQAVGGAVHALLGNHDIVILGALRFGNQATTGPGGTFLSDWLGCGGNPNDLARLQPHHQEWLMQLPALALHGETLLAHADATFYTRYGNSIEGVNHAIHGLLRSDDAGAWDHLLEDFSERMHFMGEENASVLDTFLHTFGATTFIHGHTPIPYLTKAEPSTVTAALMYANGRCVNVDGGIYMGGDGFVYELG